MDASNLSPIHKCVLCGSEPGSWSLVFHLNKLQDLVRCDDCGLVFNDLRRVDFENIYSEDLYDPCLDAPAGGGHHDYMSLEKHIQNLYRFAYSFIYDTCDKGRRYKILDVGCGCGFFLKKFKGDDRFEDFMGVDVNRRAVSVATEYFGLKVLEKRLEDTEWYSYFDFVTMFEVLEHFLDPLKAMELVAKAIKPGGFLILSTPNISNPSFKLLKSRWPALHDDIHNFYFSPETIRKLALKCGFEVEHIGEGNLLYHDVFHIRKRIGEKFPSIKPFLRIFSIFDGYVIPFPNGGDLQVILRRGGT